MQEALTLLGHEDLARAPVCACTGWKGGCRTSWQRVQSHPHQPLVHPRGKPGWPVVCAAPPAPLELYKARVSRGRGPGSRAGPSARPGGGSASETGAAGPQPELNGERDLIRLREMEHSGARADSGA